MSNTLKLRVGIVLVALGIGLILSIFNVFPAFSAAPEGIPATLATSSSATVGPQTVSVASTTASVFLGTSNCASRVISTQGFDVRLMFSNSQFSSTTANPTAAIGFLQLASTTVVYDASVYGCGFVNAYGLASTTLTISEYR